jgi:hypothetical protein
VSQRPRHGYAADLPHGLPGPLKHIAPGVPAASVDGRTHRARPVSARFEPVSQLKDVKRRFLAYSFPPRSPDPHHLAVLGTSRLCQGCSRPPRRYAVQAAPSYSDLLRQATGEGLPPPLEPQRLTAQTGIATVPWFLRTTPPMLTVTPLGRLSVLSPPGTSGMSG